MSNIKISNAELWLLADTNSLVEGSVFKNEKENIITWDGEKFVGTMTKKDLWVLDNFKYLEGVRNDKRK